jgi:hypothetical protein
VPQEIGPVSLLEFSPMNFGSCAYYRHDERSPLPTKRRKTSLIKTLTREALETRSLTEPGIKINPTMTYHGGEVRVRHDNGLAVENASRK